MTNITAMLTVRNMHDSKNEAIAFLFLSQNGWVRCSTQVAQVDLPKGWEMVFIVQGKMHHVWVEVQRAGTGGREGTKETVLIGTEN